MNPERTSLFLMANLGAEASRIISAQENGDMGASREAFERAEKILKQIGNLPEMKQRLKELGALTLALHAYSENNPSRVPAIHLKSYFAPFAERLLANPTQ